MPVWNTLSNPENPFAPHPQNPKLQATMKFMMCWKLRTGYCGEAYKKFLATQAPIPGCTSFDRYHAPGSLNGWIVIEADNIECLYEHSAEWAQFLEWEVTPVLGDAEAGPIVAKVFPEFTK